MKELNYCTEKKNDFFLETSFFFFLNIINLPPIQIALCLHPPCQIYILFLLKKILLALWTSILSEFVLLIFDVSLWSPD